MASHPRTSSHDSLAPSVASSTTGGSSSHPHGSNKGSPVARAKGATSASSVGSGESERQGGEDYVRRRERNNAAVRRSRDKAKRRLTETLKRVKQLQNENEGLQRQLDTVMQELNLLRGLYQKMGVPLPDSLTSFLSEGAPNPNTNSAASASQSSQGHAFVPVQSGVNSAPTSNYNSQAVQVVHSERSDTRVSPGPSPNASQASPSKSALTSQSHSSRISPNQNLGQIASLSSQSLLQFQMQQGAGSSPLYFGSGMGQGQP